MSVFPGALIVLVVGCCLLPAKRVGGTYTDLLSLGSNDNGKRVAVAVGQAIEITLQTIGPQQYGAPKISSNATSQWHN